MKRHVGLGGAILTVLAILYALVLPSTDELPQTLTGDVAQSENRIDQQVATAVETGNGLSDSMIDHISVNRQSPWILEAESLKKGPMDEFQLLRAEVRSLVLAGEWREAREELEKLIERYPQTTPPRAYFLAADYFCREGDENNRLRAIALLKKLQSNLAGDELAAYASLRIAGIYYGLASRSSADSHYLDEARMTLRRFLALNGDSPHSPAAEDLLAKVDEALRDRN